MPCSSRGQRITLSVAPTSRMISISSRRRCSTSVVAVVTVRMAASASTAPTPRPTPWKQPLELGETARPTGCRPATSSTSGSAASRPTSARVPSGVAIARVGRHLDRRGQRVARQLVGHVGLAAERALEHAQRLGLGRRSARAGCRPPPRSAAGASSTLGGRRLVLQVDDDPHPVAPLVDGPAEVEREQPEAAERGERERDEQDRR